MKASLERFARRAWTRQGIGGKLSWGALLPCAFVFRTIVTLRNGLYHAGWFNSSRLPRGVVSIGNITVGGTGKTPTTLWLAGELTGLGHRVAVLSRGYGVKGEGVLTESMGPVASGLPREGAEAGQASCADEPMMMSALYGHTVGVGAARYESGLQLLQKHPELDAFLLDDGFQHRQLERDFDLVLLGSEYKGSMLPAGPFREGLAALKRADAILLTGAHDEWESRLQGRCDPGKVFRGQLSPSALMTRVDGTWEHLPLSSVSGSKVLAVSGIANPDSFYRMLGEWDAEIVDTLEFPDHHQYTTEDWHAISRRGHRVEKIMTTEKDLVKLVRYPFASRTLFALRVEMLVERKQALLDSITSGLWRGP